MLCRRLCRSNKRKCISPLKAVLWIIQLRIAKLLSFPEHNGEKIASLVTGNFQEKRTRILCRTDWSGRRTRRREGEGGERASLLGQFGDRSRLKKNLCFFFSRGVLRYFTQTWRNNSFQCLLRRLPRPQDVGHLSLRYFNFFNPFYNLNCSARERAPLRRVTEKSHFSTLNVGLAGTGNRTQATCLAGSVTRRSAIHYAS
jgi:hypothetical protein